MRHPLRVVDAKLGQPEINLGIIPGWGGTQRLARVCGLGVAKELILTGRTVDADEAFASASSTPSSSPASCWSKTLETARLLASKSPIALAAAKVAINHALQGDHVENLDREADLFGELFASEDAKEGMPRSSRSASRASSAAETRPPRREADALADRALGAPELLLHRRSCG